MYFYTWLQSLRKRSMTNMRSAGAGSYKTDTWQCHNAVSPAGSYSETHCASRETLQSHQQSWRSVQNLQTRQAGHQPAEAQVDSVVCQGQVAQVQHFQLWQRRERPQVAGANALFMGMQKLADWQCELNHMHAGAAT